MQLAAIVGLTTVCLAVARADRLPAAQVRSFRDGGRDVTYEVLDGGTGTPLMVLLPGTSGPRSPFYQDQAKLFQRSGFTVLLLHYFDATTSPKTTDANYRAWVAAVETLVGLCGKDAEFRGRKVVLMGYSLGASIVLAVGSQSPPVTAIAEWYGSLPDVFFGERKSMPPLLILHGMDDTNIPVINAQQLQRLCVMDKLECESHLYPDEGHGFSEAASADANRRTLEFLKRRLQ